MNPNEIPVGDEQLAGVEEPLTAKQKKDYLESGGVSCPFCGDSDITGNSFDVDGDTVSQRVSCVSCDRVWRDVYRLEDVFEED